MMVLSLIALRVTLPVGKRQKRSDVGRQMGLTIEGTEEECPFPLMDLPEEVLLRVLEALPAQQLLSVSRVSHAVVLAYRYQAR